jgi:hypothetical protein
LDRRAARQLVLLAHQHPRRQGLFSVYRTNGKVIRVILSRPFSESEAYFYQRRMTQSLLT